MYNAIPNLLPSTKTKTKYPVTLNEAKLHLRLDTSTMTPDYYDEDTYLQNVIYAATEAAEQFIEKDIALTDNVAEYYDYSSDTITLDEGNFIGVTSIVSDASVLSTVSETRKYYNGTYIKLAASVTSDPLTINYQTGFDPSTNAAPYNIKQAILIKIASMYDIDRSDYTLSIFKEGKAFERLLMPYKLILM